MSRDRWKQHEAERREHFDAVHFGCWRNGLGEPHSDHVAASFDRGETPERFIVRRRQEREERAAREQLAREEADADERRREEEGRADDAEDDGATEVT